MNKLLFQGFSGPLLFLNQGQTSPWVSQSKNVCTRKNRAKGQLISKADWHAIDSPKKMDEFILFAIYSSWQTNQICSFVFWKNLRRTNLLFDFI